MAVIIDIDLPNICDECPLSSLSNECPLLNIDCEEEMGGRDLNCPLKPADVVESSEYEKALKEISKLQKENKNLRDRVIDLSSDLIKQYMK